MIYYTIKYKPRLFTTYTSDHANMSMVIPLMPNDNEFELYMNCTYNQDRKFRITDIRFINCHQTNIPFDCDFNSPHCTWWFDSTRFEQWHHFSEQGNGYIANNKNNIAEIRSPLIQKTSEKGSCLTFNYRNTGDRNSLQVTKMELLNSTLHNETVIWSTRNITEASWTSARIFINTSQSIDIGFVSVAIDGEVAIDNVALRDGPCYSSVENAEAFSLNLAYSINKFGFNYFNLISINTNLLIIMVVMLIV